MEYSAVLLIPKDVTKNHPPQIELKDNAGDIKMLQEAIKEAAVEKWAAQAKGYKIPLKDGDKELNSEGIAKAPGFWMLSVMSYAEEQDGSPREAPMVKDARNVPINDSYGWVSGDWGRAKVFFAPYDTSGNKGVKAYLNALQWLYKDEPFGAARDDEFDVVEDGQAATSAGPSADEYDPFADE